MSRATLLRVDSPIGPVLLRVEGQCLRALDLDADEERVRARVAEGDALLLGVDVSQQPIARAVAAYFAGALDALDAIEVRPDGTQFQRTVWRELRRIPAGSTISYAELATRVGRPRALRAVGAANGRNPVPLVVPCHRVIAADGTLGGYSGGLWKKAWLLRHEGAKTARQGTLALGG